MGGSGCPDGQGLDHGRGTSGARQQHSPSRNPRGSQCRVRTGGAGQSGGGGGDGSGGGAGGGVAAAGGQRHSGWPLPPSACHPPAVVPRSGQAKLSANA